MVQPSGGEFLVIGHRGAAAKAPENTAASLRAGIEGGAGAIEIDVGLSSDGRVALLHDATLDRTTDGRGPLYRRSWSELTRLDAGSWFGRRFEGEPLLDLDAALALVRGRVAIIVEIKARSQGDQVQPEDLRLAEAVLAALRRTGGTEGAVISSASWLLLEEIARRYTGVELALTVGIRHPRDPFVVARAVGATALHPNRRLVTREFMGRARAQGLPIIPYTVNRAPELYPLLDLGVDGVFTDDPAGLRRLLQKRRPAPDPPPPLTLGIDQGSGGSRAVLVSGDGKVLLSRAVTVASRRGRGGTIFQDPEAIVASVIRAAAPLLEAPPGPIVAAGLATQRSSLVIWRRSDGRPAAPIVSWRSTRLAAIPESFLSREAAIHRITGLTPRFPYAGIRLAELMHSGDPVAEGLRSGRLTAGPVGAYLAARLSGSRAGGVDPSLAQRMLLFDIRRRQWDPGLVALSGTRVESLPEILHSCADRGTIRIGRKRLRLRSLVGDAGAAFRAVAGRTGYGAVLVLGTGGFVLVGTGPKPVHVPGLLTTILWEDVEGPRFAVEGTVHGLLASLLEAGKRGGLERLCPELVAAHSGPASRAPWVVPAPEGIGTPEWTLAPRFEVEQGTWSAEELVRGTLEGLSERFGRIGDLLRDSGLLPERFIATGGLAFAPHLVSAISGRLGVPIRVDPHPDRAAVGAALLAR